MKKIRRVLVLLLSERLPMLLSQISAVTARSVGARTCTAAIPMDAVIAQQTQ